jgi:hypothetical protein
VAPSRYLALVCAATAAAGGAGCGGDSKTSDSVARESTASSTTAPAPQPSTGSARRQGAAGARIRLPRGWHAVAKPVTRRNWPVPLKVAASFPVRRGSPNASCPSNVLRSFPPDGVYLMFAEFTKARPPGVPARGPLPPRGDLRKLDVRPSEVECWEKGLSGAKDFGESGRSFRVEILLGPRVSAARRRQALEALASFRVPPRGG